MPRISAQRLAALLLTASLGAACSRSKPEPPPVIDPASRRVAPAGEVVGFVGQYDSHVWRGIPYAQPPVGDLRWRAPQPAAPWEGTLEAVEFGSPCPQFASGLGGARDLPSGARMGGEDCLSLNIYAPRAAPEEVPAGRARLPAMVWIHGGGNVIGHGGFYDGGNLAARHDVVVVTLNYRLGPFGWFRHAALREGATPEEASGNFGTLDLIRALEWVRENIAAFGGDPKNVTIFGQSAGARNVYTLLLSPRARGLFQRAIVQSGGFRFTGLAEAEQLADAAIPGHRFSSNEVLVSLRVADGMAEDRDAAKQQLAGMPSREVASMLRSADPFEILDLYGMREGRTLIDVPQIFADGVVLPTQAPLERFARADGYNRVPVILGTNRDEEKLFMYFQSRWVQRILWIFPRLRDPERYNATAEHLSAMWKATGADEPAAALRRTQGPSVFVYRFDWDEEPRLFGADLSEMLGAAHAFEIPFAFGHFDLGRAGNLMFTEKNEPGRRELSEQMMSYWAQFAYAGDPGRGRKGDLPEWRAWDPQRLDAPKFMVFDTKRGGGLRMSSERVSVASVLAAVDEDPRFGTQRQRCDMYRELARSARGFSQQDYPTAGKLGCRDYPYETLAQTD